MDVNMENKVYIKFPAIPENARMARMLASAFLAEFNPTLEEIDDVKTAVSEAVTNCIIHAYEKEERNKKNVELTLIRDGNDFVITVVDQGCGIDNIEKAMEPMFTTKREEERSGMGFSFMEAFMDDVEVFSSAYDGTKVVMRKRINTREE